MLSEMERKESQFHYRQLASSESVEENIRRTPGPPQTHLFSSHTTSHLGFVNRQ